MKKAQRILLALSVFTFATPAVLRSNGQQDEASQPAEFSLSSSEAGDAAKTLSHSIAAITKPDQLEIRDRVHAVRMLGDQLTRNEISELYTFLKALPHADEKNRGGLQLIKNDILDVLQEQAIPPVGFTETMIEIYRNRSQDPVSRDYAMQHLVSWFEKGARDASDAREKIRAALHQAVEENDSIAGTALLGMHRLSAYDAAFSSEKIKSIALRWVQSATTHPFARITAVQICAERGLKEALPVIESLAQSPENIALQISAIAALGQLGGTRQAELLQQFKSQETTPLRTAINAALKQLQQKQELY